MNENTKVDFCAGTFNEYLPSKSVIVPKADTLYSNVYTDYCFACGIFNDTRNDSARLGLSINCRNQEEGVTS